jgi:hypothetical protein
MWSVQAPAAAARCSNQLDRFRWGRSTTPHEFSGALKNGLCFLMSREADSFDNSGVLKPGNFQFWERATVPAYWGDGKTRGTKPWRPKTVTQQKGYDKPFLTSGLTWLFARDSISPGRIGFLIFHFGYLPRARRLARRSQPSLAPRAASGS